MSPALQDRMSIVALALAALCVAATSALAQLTRSPTGTTTSTTTESLRRTTLTAVPMDPAATSLRADIIGPGGVRLSWAGVSGVTRYFVTGPGVGDGLEVTSTIAVISSVPGGPQQWAVASMPATGGVLSDPKTWPRVSADMPFFGPPRSTVWYENEAFVDFNFQIVREATNLRLFRTVGTNPPVEIALPATYSRAPNGPGDNVNVRIAFPDMQPDVQYNFNFTAAFPNAGTRTSEYVTARIPLFMLRTTVPPAGDRVIVEWNPFGIAPYTLEKGMMMQQAGTSFAAYDPVRDASGNPISFTTLLRYEDLTIQRGATYRYKVCANLPSGRACPTVTVTVP